MPRSTAFAVLIISFTVLTLTACSDAQNSDTGSTVLTSEDRGAIEALLDSYADRAIAGDWEGHANLLHTDVMRKYAGTSDFLTGRQTILDANTAANPNITKLEFDIVEVDGTRELAYVIVKNRLEVTTDNNGEDVIYSDEGTSLMIVRPDETGTWLISRTLHHSNL
jgi:hypothetical protein